MSQLPGIRMRLPNTCGAFLVHSFHINPPLYGVDNPNDQEGYHQSAGWVMVGFINDNRCLKVYKAWSSKYTIAWQSPVRINHNSGRQFFIVIFDTRSRKD